MRRRIKQERKEGGIDESIIQLFNCLVKTSE